MESPNQYLSLEALFCDEWLHQFGDPRVQRVLNYPPPHSRPRLWFFFKRPMYEKPQLVSFTRALFCHK